MDWLMHNQIADMPGPLFLLFYGIVIVVTLGLVWWFPRLRDSTKDMPVPTVSIQPDPYEISYLRGGANEVALTVVFDLYLRGYLQSTGREDIKITQKSKAPDARHLEPLERVVFEWFSKPHTIKEVSRTELPATLARTEQCAEYQRRLDNEKLLLTPEARKFHWIALVIGALTIAGLGSYKLLVALAKGRTNVLFLIVMGIIALSLLFWKFRPPRLSSRGRTYLEKMQTAFENLKVTASTSSSLVAKPPAESSSFPLLVGVFGVAALAGTSYASYQGLFQRQKSGWSGWGGGGNRGWFSSCGSSCGSCGGGGGCGGGCGGCGGCGG